MGNVWYRYNRSILLQQWSTMKLVSRDTRGYGRGISVGEMSVRRSRDHSLAHPVVEGMSEVELFIVEGVRVKDQMV